MENWELDEQIKQDLKITPFIISSAYLLGRGFYDSYTETPTFPFRNYDILASGYLFSFFSAKERNKAFDEVVDGLGSAFESWFLTPIACGVSYGAGYLAGKLFKTL